MRPVEIPDSFTTARLLIRVPREGDAPMVHETVQANQEHLKPWMPFAVRVMSLAEYETYVKACYEKFLHHLDIPLLLIDKQSGEMVGSSGLHRFDWAIPKFEIGYWVAKKYEGQGYVCEAVNGITQFAAEVLGAKRVEIRCDARNERSAAVARRAGYTLEGTLRQDSRHHLTHELRDTHIFAKIF
jgi:RimJ/RimL family protein N-acetyltransferase